MDILTPIKATTAVVSVVALALIFAACGGPAASSTPPGSAPPAASAPLAAALDLGLDALVASIGEHDGKAVRVIGNLVAQDGVARLCGALLESYPPQCGGPSLKILGEIPADVVNRLDRTSDPGLAQVLWGTVLVTGTIDADAAGDPTLTITSIEIPPSA